MGNTRANLPRREEDSVVVEKRNRVAKVLLNRPQALNALDDRMKNDLGRALHDLENDPSVRCVVITGEGRSFSAGEDVPSFRARNFASIGKILEEKYHPIILSLRSMEKPVIAAVNGIAAGGGASIALACDIRIASNKASIKMAFVGMGLVPDAGSSFFLSELVGRGRAMELVFTGRTVEAKEAIALGLFNKVVAPAKLESTVQALATELANGPATALGLSKRVMNRVPLLTLPEAMKLEAETQQVASETNDHHEAVNAFLEKRKPRFA